MKDKKRKYILMIILLGVLMLLSGCVRKECEEKVKDLEFTVTKEEELPEALRKSKCLTDCIKAPYFAPDNRSRYRPRPHSIT